MRFGDSCPIALMPSRTVHSNTAIRCPLPILRPALEISIRSIGFLSPQLLPPARKYMNVFSALSEHADRPIGH